jgi:hypothetical protein
VEQLGEWQYTCDRIATIDAYQRAVESGSGSCSCAGCRNFVAARAQVFPEPFLALLDSLGIDPAKNGDVYHIARRSPGRHIYGGWYHFIGTLEIAGDYAAVNLERGFMTSLCLASAPSLDTLAGQPLVQVEFHTDDVPWVLSEQEPD